MITVKESVPNSLSGGSLLDAHNWVRSKMAKRNPTGSNADYSLTTVDGTPVTLSDLTSLNKTFDEVIINADSSDVIPNPHEKGHVTHKPIPEGDYRPPYDPSRGKRRGSQYPVPVPDYDYPHYASAPRIGNEITSLLPSQIEPSMVERLAAQEGYFGALNTLTQLHYQSERGENEYTSPDMAAMIQRYSNATSKDRHTRKNPSRPFYAKEVEAHKGVVSPESAVSSFLGARYGGVTDYGSPLDQDTTQTLLNAAQIYSEYQMDDGLLDEFIGESMLPYLAVAESNRGLLRAMNENRDVLNRTLMTGGFLTRLINIARDEGGIGATLMNLVPFTGNRTYSRAVRGETERILGLSGEEEIFDNIVYEKLLAILPLRPEQFYYGMDYSLIADPLFMEPVGSSAGINPETVRYIYQIAAQAPTSLANARTIEGLRFRRTVPGRFLSWMRRSGLPVVGGADSDYYMTNVRQLQMGILDELSNTENPMDVLDNFYRRAEVITGDAVQQMQPQDKVMVLQGGFGMRPTVPPYWPEQIVFSVMETISENIHNIRKNESSYDKALMILNTDATYRERANDLPPSGRLVQFTVENNEVRLDTEPDPNNPNLLQNYDAATLNYQNLDRLILVLDDIIRPDFTPPPGMIRDQFFINNNVGAGGLFRNNNQTEGITSGNNSRQDLGIAGNINLDSGYNGAENTMVNGNLPNPTWDLANPGAGIAGAIPLGAPPAVTYELPSAVMWNQDQKDLFGNRIRHLLRAKFGGTRFAKYKEEGANGFWHHSGWRAGTNYTQGLAKLRQIRTDLAEIRDEVRDRVLMLPQPLGLGNRKHEQMVPFLSLFLEVERKSRVRGYTLTEKDRAFTLWFLKETLRRMDNRIGLGQVIQGGRLAGPPRRISQLDTDIVREIRDPEFLENFLPEGMPEERREQSERQLRTYATFQQFVNGDGDGLIDGVLLPRLNAGTLYDGDEQLILNDLRGILRGTNVGPNPEWATEYDLILEDITQAFQNAPPQAGPDGSQVPNPAFGVAGHNPEYLPDTNMAISNMNNYRNFMRLMRQAFQPAGDYDFGFPNMTQAQRQGIVGQLANQVVQLQHPNLNNMFNLNLQNVQGAYLNLAQDLAQTYANANTRWQEITSLLIQPNAPGNTLQNLKNDVQAVLDDYINDNNQPSSADRMVLRLQGFVALAQREEQFFDEFGAPNLNLLQNIIARANAALVLVEQINDELQRIFLDLNGPVQELLQIPDGNPNIIPGEFGTYQNNMFADFSFQFENAMNDNDFFTLPSLTRQLQEEMPQLFNVAPANATSLAVTNNLVNQIIQFFPNVVFVAINNNNLLAVLPNVQATFNGIAPLPGVNAAVLDQRCAAFNP